MRDEPAGTVATSVERALVLLLPTVAKQLLGRET